MENNLTQFKLIDIEKNRRFRPQGYYEDVISKGQIHGEYLILDFDDAVALIEKYSEQNPILDERMEAAAWGPVLWRLLHERPEQYDLDSEAELRWLDIFKSWIPCGDCKNHFVDILKTAPPDLDSKARYKQWAEDVHNVVNVSLGKPEFHSAIRASMP